jgi:hypothetical protein
LAVIFISGGYTLTANKLKVYGYDYDENMIILCEAFEVASKE